MVKISVSATSAGWTRFLTIVAKSESREWKLWTGHLAAVVLVRALRCAAADRWAGATTEVRAAWAAAAS